MKNAKTYLFLCALSLCAFGCQTVENVGDDAKRTPIGSVITGETKSADSYIKRVSEQNKSLDKETWRPQNSERF